MNQGKSSIWIWLLELSSLVSSSAAMVSGIPSEPPSPSLPLSYRSTVTRFLEGFLNSYRDTGFLPKWLAPDERGYDARYTFRWYYRR